MGNRNAEVLSNIMMLSYGAVPPSDDLLKREGYHLMDNKGHPYYDVRHNLNKVLCKSNQLLFNRHHRVNIVDYRFINPNAVLEVMLYLATNNICYLENLYENTDVHTNPYDFPNVLPTKPRLLSVYNEVPISNDTIHNMLNINPNLCTNIEQRMFLHGLTLGNGIFKEQLRTTITLTARGRLLFSMVTYNSIAQAVIVAYPKLYPNDILKWVDSLDMYLLWEEQHNRSTSKFETEFHKLWYNLVFTEEGLEVLRPLMNRTYVDRNILEGFSAIVTGAEIADVLLPVAIGRWGLTVRKSLFKDKALPAPDALETEVTRVLNMVYEGYDLQQIIPNILEGIMLSTDCVQSLINKLEQIKG